MLPLIQKDVFFELPHASDVLCKGKLSSHNGVECVVLKRKDGSLTWTLTMSDVKSYAVSGDIGFNIPTKIVELIEFSDGADPIEKTTNLTDLKFNKDADRSILQIDAS